MASETRATPGAPAPDGAGHRPVLLHHLIESLQPQPGQTAVDATLGGGGVTEALLTRVAPGGRVIAIDRDESAIASARTMTVPDGVVLDLVHDDFAELDTIIHGLGDPVVDAIAFDLGISSLQLDDATRGFSFSRDGPLDMRMDRRDDSSAAGIVNGLAEDDLAQLIRELGDERFARRIAHGIVNARRRSPLETTAQLRRIVESAIPRRMWPKRIHPATRTFQALRIAVNGELDSLERGLQAALHILRPGGRLGVISFHSLEDTLVKNALHVAATSCMCPPQQPHCTCAHRATVSLITRRAIRPDDGEIAANPRARSARLRVAEKLALPTHPAFQRQPNLGSAEPRVRQVHHP